MEETKAKAYRDAVEFYYQADEAGCRGEIVEAARLSAEAFERAGDADDLQLRHMMDAVATAYKHGAEAANT